MSKEDNETRVRRLRRIIIMYNNLTDELLAYALENERLLDQDQRKA